MSEEQNVAPEATEETTEVSAKRGTRIQDVETLQKELDKARAEAAKRRVDEKELKRLEEDASKWQEHLDSQKSELDRLKDEKKRLEKDLKAEKLEKLQVKIAHEYKLDADLMEFVTGSDEDEMRAKAEKLATRASKESSPDFYAGARGAPVVRKAKAGGAFLESLAKDMS